MNELVPTVRRRDVEALLYETDPEVFLASTKDSPLLSRFPNSTFIANCVAR